jgi:hypothetical protein
MPLGLLVVHVAMLATFKLVVVASGAKVGSKMRFDVKVWRKTIL